MLIHAVSCYKRYVNTNQDFATGSDDGSKSLPAGRKADLIAVVTEKRQVTVADLADRFGVSVDTIRRDLDALDAEGLVIRTHGGAVSPSAPARPDSGIGVRRRVQAAAKETIGAIAAGLVEDGSTIMINAGTTALAVARHLKHHRGLTIATNNVMLPAEIDAEAYRNLYVFGGTVRANDLATIGPVVFTGAAGEDIDVRCELALIAVGGITSDAGYSTSNLAEAAMMRSMMTRANRVGVLIDSTKFDRRLFAQFAPLSAADYVITDKAPDADLSSALADAGVEILLPSE
jgi:DeoR/GlpR family transcriptional regulator of sugar metabolism